MDHYSGLKLKWRSCDGEKPPTNRSAGAADNLRASCKGRQLYLEGKLNRGHPRSTRPQDISGSHGAKETCPGEQRRQREAKKTELGWSSLRWCGEMAESSVAQAVGEQCTQQIGDFSVDERPLVSSTATTKHCISLCSSTFPHNASRSQLFIHDSAHRSAHICRSTRTRIHVESFCGWHVCVRIALNFSSRPQKCFSGSPVVADVTLNAEHHQKNAKASRPMLGPGNRYCRHKPQNRNEISRQPHQGQKTDLIRRPLEADTRATCGMSAPAAATRSRGNSTLRAHGRSKFSKHA